MKKGNLLRHVVEALGLVKLPGRKSDPKLGALDRGVLEVALMIAALDGEIMPAEYETFELLAKQCRGYTQKNAKQCLDCALRKAGYLMAAAQVGCYPPAERIASFVKMAAEALPNGFAFGSETDLRRAFVLWIAMAVSDGAFSELEHSAVEALRDHFERVSLERRQTVEARCAAMNPAFPFVSAPKINTRKVTLFEADFFGRAEEVVKQLGDARTRKAAQDAFAELVQAAVAG